MALPYVLKSTLSWFIFHLMIVELVSPVPEYSQQVEVDYKWLLST